MKRARRGKAEEALPALLAASGGPACLMSAIADRRERFRRAFGLAIDIQGADHSGQFPFVREVAARLGLALAVGFVPASDFARLAVPAPERM